MALTDDGEVPKGGVPILLGANVIPQMYNTR